METGLLLYRSTRYSLEKVHVFQGFYLAIKNGGTWQDMLSLTPLFKTDSLPLSMRIAKIMIM